MWRVALSIVAVILDAGLIVVAILGAIGFLGDMTTHRLSTGAWVGLVFVVAAGVGGLANIIAIGFGARLPGQTRASPAQVAAEFS